MLLMQFYSKSLFVYFSIPLTFEDCWFLLLCKELCTDSIVDFLVRTSRLPLCLAADTYIRTPLPIDILVDLDSLWETQQVLSLKCWPLLQLVETLGILI